MYLYRDSEGFAHIAEGVVIDYTKTTARTEVRLHTKDSFDVMMADKKNASKITSKGAFKAGAIKAEDHGSITENAFSDKEWKAFRTACASPVIKADKLPLPLEYPHTTKATNTAAQQKKIRDRHEKEGWTYKPLHEEAYAESLHQNTNKGKKVESAILSSSLEYAFEPDMSVEEPREYFGIPSMYKTMRSMVSDAEYAKKQREKPQSFIGKWEFLSNMYLSPVILGDMVFPSAENAYQAMKCKTHAEMEQFQYCTPYEAKRLGAEVDVRSNWDDIKVKVMKKILEAKFEDQELAIQLLNTGDMLLCEKNYWGDDFWGKTLKEETHYYADCEEITAREYNVKLNAGNAVLQKTTKKTIKGENMLGKLLCQVREEIRASHVYDPYLTGYAEQADVNVDWLGRG